MADTRIDLEVLLKSVGITATTKKIEQLAKKLQKTGTITANVSKEQNKLKRNLEGVAQRSGRAGKDFSRMSQGMGGLVQAYATVAANVFALSSAFLVLRRTADLSSMIKSAEDFSNRFGVSVTRITKQMQEASGGALSFAQALPSINKAVSAGIGIADLEKLSVAATKASQTFGGTANEALNRFISASQRGRVEIIQTLGVVIKTEQAYADYAASIGKTAQELTAFDRQQAIINATIEESAKVFDGVKIDPNPFQQLLTTVVDLKDTIGIFITDSLTPLVNTFNKSKAAALALIATIISAVGGRIFPEVSRGIKGFAKAGLESTRNAQRAIRVAREKEAKLILLTERKVNKLTSDQLKQRSGLFKKYYSDVLLQGRVFQKELINSTGQVNKVVLTQQRAAIARELKARKAGTGMMDQFKGIPTRALENEANRLTVIAKRTAGVAVAQDKWTTAIGATDKRMQVFLSKTGLGLSKVKAGIEGVKSGLKSGFAQGFRIAEGSIIQSITRMNVTWIAFIRSLGTGAKSGASSLALLARAFGATAGIIGGALSGIFAIGLKLIFWVSTITVLWELFGDKITKTTKAQKAAREAAGELSDSLKEITERTREQTITFDNSIVSTQRLIKSFEFIRGTLDSTLNSFTQFDKALVSQFGQGSTNILEYSKTLQDNVSKLSSDVSDFLELIPRKSGERDPLSVSTRGTDLSALGTVALAEFKKLNIELDAAYVNLEDFRKVGLEISKETGPEIVENFIAINKLLESRNFTQFGIDTFNSLKNTLPQITNESEKLIALLESGKGTEFFKELSEIAGEEQIAVISALVNVMKEFAPAAFEGASALGAANRSLQDISQRVDNFIQGIDKLKAASVPNKEIFNFLLDMEVQLTNIAEQSAKVGNTVDFTRLIQEGDLETLKKFVNVGKDVNLEETIQAVRRQKELYLKVINDAITGAEKLKRINLDLKILSLEEVDSDQRRVEIIEKRLRFEQEAANLQAVIAQNNLNVVRDQIRQLRVFDQESANRLKILIEEEKTLEKTRDTQLAIVAELSRRKDAEREIFKIRKEALSTEEKINKTRLSTEKINKKLSENNVEDLQIRLNIYKFEKESLNIAKRKLIEEQNALFVQELTLEQQIRRKNEIREELRLLEAQTRELERQKLLLQAETAEQRGVAIWDREGISLAVDFFYREIRDQARNLKTTFQILGEGFATGLNNTIDASVDKLLEGVWGKGGRDFGEAFVEILKEQGRAVFGEALKTQIRDAFAGIFNTSTQEQQVAQRHAEQITAVTFQTRAIEDNTAALRQIDFSQEELSVFGTVLPKPEKKSEALSVFGTVLPQPGVEKEVKAPDTVGAIEVLTNITKSTQNELANVFGIGNEIATVAKNEQKSGFFDLISIIGSLISAFASSSAGNFFSSFFAKGGIIPGGTSFTSRAAGGVTSGPEMALIGEGKNNEAVVPLPNNREIPVELKGTTGDTINITQSFDFRNADANIIPRLRQEAKNIEDNTFNKVFAEINRGGRYAKLSGRR